MAGEELGVDPARVVDPPTEAPEKPKPKPERDTDLRAAVICPIPGLPANRCCRSFPLPEAQAREQAAAAGA